MSIAEDRAIFHRAHLAWGEGDLAAFLDCLTEDVVYIVNVDGLQVPYASSANGRSEVRTRLQLLLDTFVVNAFVVESMFHDVDASRSIVLGYFKHKRTGERLDVKLRFVARFRDGRISRLEEYLDAAYVEAFQRFVNYLEEEAARATSGAADRPSSPGGAAAPDRRDRES